MKKNDLFRININLSKQLLEKVDEYASNLSVNRTVAITILLNNALTSEKALGDVTELIKLVNNNQALLQMKGDER